jgi:UDP-N-acetylglucosamine:LPS N-acetylglucosamine transferase
LGIAAARQAGIPSVLVENFTWDWIYQGYTGQCPQLQPHIDYLATVFAQADHRIQASPICRQVSGTLGVDPVVRSLHQPDGLRQRLYCAPNQRLVLLTMGGIFSGSRPLVDFAQLVRRPEAVFVLIGQSRENEFTQNLRFLAANDLWYHPDLVAAADLVVGKTGYSTVAEAYQGNTAYAYLARKDFRESAVLEDFLDRHMLSWKITQQQLESGQWLEKLSRLPAEKNPPVQAVRGADQVAEFLVDQLLKEHPCRILK